MNIKQKIFCAEYLIDFNATRAAIRAGYSENGANDYAKELMAREDIQLAIDTLIQERAAKIGVNQEWVLQEMVFEARAARGSSKIRALELIGRHIGMFKDELNVNLGLARKAEEFAKLTKDQQLELMKEEVKRLEGESEATTDKETT